MNMKRLLTGLVVFLAVGMPLLSQTYGLSGSGLSSVCFMQSGPDYSWCIDEEKDDSPVTITLFSWSSQGEGGSASGYVSCTHNGETYSGHDSNTTYSITREDRFGLYHFEYSISSSEPGSSRQEQRDEYVVRKIGAPSVHNGSGNPYGVSRDGNGYSYLNNTFDFNGMGLNLSRYIRYVLCLRNSNGLVSSTTISDTNLEGTYLNRAISAYAVTGRYQVTVLPILTYGTHDYSFSESDALTLYIDSSGPEITINSNVKRGEDLVWQNEESPPRIFHVASHSLICPEIHPVTKPRLV
jgi:hypothetical protein